MNQTVSTVHDQMPRPILSSEGLAIEVMGCFDAAYVEGLEEALNDSSSHAQLKDLVERRLMYAYYAAVEHLKDKSVIRVS